MQIVCDWWYFRRLTVHANSSIFGLAFFEKTVKLRKFFQFADAHLETLSNLYDRTFWDNSSPLKDGNYFRKKVPS